VFTCSCRLDSKGRVTLPCRIRQKLGLEAGDELEISVRGSKIKRKEVSSFDEAKAFIEDFSEVKSFSFDGEVVEVVVRG